jgi:hypothetical protein
MTILLIKYAVSGCTSEQVTQIFNTEFEGPVVEKVVTINKINYTTGAPFHMFFVHLTKTPTEPLQEFLSKFTDNAVQRIIYDHPWFWNVVVAQPRARSDPDIQHAVKHMPEWMKN